MHKIERKFIVTAENARKKDFVKICGQFFRQILLLWPSTMLFLKVRTCFWEAFDIVFHNHESFYHMSTPYSHITIMCPIIGASLSEPQSLQRNSIFWYVRLYVHLTVSRISWADLSVVDYIFFSKINTFACTFFKVQPYSLLFGIPSTHWNGTWAKFKCTSQVWHVIWELDYVDC